MKAKVLKKFKDKYTGKIHKAGSTIDVSKERFEEILTVDKFVEEVAEEAVEEVAEEVAETVEEAGETPKKTTRKTTKKSAE